jgi:hypothetical protein
MRGLDERALEDFLSRQTRTLGGRSLKFVSPGRVGVPDRIVLLPVDLEHQAIVARYLKFVEVKATGQKPRPIQLAFIAEMQSLGFFADVVDSKEKIHALFA